MTFDSTINKEESFFKAAENLNKARMFDGSPSDFWGFYLEALIEMLSAVVGIFAVRDPGQGHAWQTVAFAPESQKFGLHSQELIRRLDEIESACKDEGSSLLDAQDGFLVAARLDTGKDTDNCLAIFFLKDRIKQHAGEKLKYLRLAVDIPANYQMSRVAVDSKTRVEHFAGVFDLMVLVNKETKFLAAAMTFCNELASRLKCERVSLGWYDKGYVRLQAMSHADNFDRKMEAVQQLEAAMEEALDQDADIVKASSFDSADIIRAHEDYAQAQGTKYICSFPLRLKGEPVAVCTCERELAEFSEIELRLLRLCCDQAMARLSDLKRYDRWFGARMAMAAREKLAAFIGYEYTWAKVLAVFISLILAFVCFVPVPFRIDAPVILRTDDLSYLTAAFEGHIEKVFYRVGDILKQEDEILAFDSNDLLLEEIAASAEENRYQREFEKARANSALAQMREAEALRDQAAARLELIRYRLQRSVIRMPFDGVIVEGDLNERIGAPVKEGEVLFKIARTDRLYAELEVSESDIHFVKNHMNGEIALASRPQDIIRIRVFKIEPVAVAKNKGNVFIVHVNFIQTRPDWWQPGLTGVAKLNAGRRPLIWILTRKTIDFLRLRLWW